MQQVHMGCSHPEVNPVNGQLTQCMSLAFGLAQIMHACSNSAANMYASRQLWMTEPHSRIIETHQQTDDFGVDRSTMSHSLRQPAPRRGALRQTVRQLPAPARSCSPCCGSYVRWMWWGTKAAASAVQLLQGNSRLPQLCSVAGPSVKDLQPFCWTIGCCTRVNYDTRQSSGSCMVSPIDSNSTRHYPAPHLAQWHCHRWKPH